MIKKPLVYKSPEIILQLHKSLVRPQLEYCIQVWRPCLQKDITLLERIPHHMTRMTPGYKHIPYEDKLTKLGLLTLQQRQLQWDLIEVF